MCGGSAPRPVSRSRPTGAAATRSGGAGLSGVQNDDGMRRYWGGPPGYRGNPHGNSDRDIEARRQRRRELEEQGYRRGPEGKPKPKPKPKPKNRRSLITPPPTPPPAPPAQSLIVPAYGVGAFGAGRDFLRRTG